MPLAGLPPLVATALGLLVAAAAVGPALAGGRLADRRRASWSGCPGLLDSLDGALAIATGRASRRGFVLDSAVDRLTEAAYAAALWVAGAPGWLAAAVRRAVLAARLPAGPRRAGRGAPRPGRSRCGSGRPGSILTGFTLGGAGVVAAARRRRPSSSPPARPPVPCSGAVAAAQLGVSLRRALAD